MKDRVNRIQKIYCDSVKENRRSGGGKVVTDNWETLVFLWEGSPSVKSLPYGQSSADSLENEHENEEGER